MSDIENGSLDCKWDEILYKSHHTMIKMLEQKNAFDIIEELEHLKAVIRFNGLYNEQIEDLIDIEIKGLKGENEC